MEAKTVLLKGKTGNAFSFFNLDDVSSCYKYYEEYANKLVKAMQPDKNPFHEKDIKGLDFAYLWKEDLNAGSCEDKTKDYVEINEGTIIKIYCLFYRLMTKKGGVIPLSEIVPPHIEIDNYVTYENKNTGEKIKYTLILSDSTVLNNIAEYMSMFAIKWIIAHEIGHAYNGHTNYYCKVRRRIKEIGIPSEDNFKEFIQCFLDLQTMEMDADTFASSQIMTEAIFLYKAGLNRKLKIQNNIDVLKLPIFAIHGALYLMRDYNTLNTFFVEHPPAFVRESQAIGAAKATLESNHILFGDDFYIGDIGNLDNMISQSHDISNAAYIKYIEGFHKEAAEWAEMITNNYFNRISKIIKSESRMPVEGIDYFSTDF